MKVLLKSFIIYFFIVPQFFAQGVMKIETNKNTYNYGDSIEVRVTITNDSDTSFSIWGSSSCMVMLGFNNVPFQFFCTSDYREFKFAPNTAMTWIWNLEPDVLGIPDMDGEQTIYATGSGHMDSIKILAPKYYGGQLSVGIKMDVSPEEIQSLRDSLNVEVLWSDPLTGVGTLLERWFVKGYSIDSIANVYSNDYRLKYIEINRVLNLTHVIVTSIKNDEENPTRFILSQNYPNPFNPNTRISYSIAFTSNVAIKVYDVLGNEVATLVNEEKPAGDYQIDFNASELSSGVYIYKIQAGNFINSKKMILLK